MKIGCKIKNIDTIFSEFSSSAKTLKKSLENPETLPEMVLSGNLYKIDRLCMRNRLKNTKSMRKVDNIKGRFFECKECSRFKMYKEMVNLDSVTNIDVLTYKEVVQKIEIGDNQVLSDEFSNIMIINQYLFAEDLAGIDFPVNAFICGQTGFIYYLKGEKSNIYKSMYDKLTTDLKLLNKYKFGFNSLPKNRFVVLESSRKGKSNLYIKIPDHPGILTGDGLNIREYTLFDFILPGDMYVLTKKYVQLNLDTDQKIKKFKYLRVSGKLDTRINYVLNVILYFVEIEKVYSINMKEWNTFWTEETKTPDLEEFKKISDYDSFLRALNGKKIHLK